MKSQETAETTLRPTDSLGLDILNSSSHLSLNQIKICLCNCERASQ